MPSAWVVEGVDIVSDLSLGLDPGFVNGAPDQLGFDGSEHGFDHGIVVAGCCQTNAKVSSLCGARAGRFWPQAIRDFYSAMAA